MKTDGMNPITEDDIANYLANTPDFFSRHAQLLAAVQLTSPHGTRAVSLQERQAEMLREKIKALEHRIMDMVRHGYQPVYRPKVFDFREIVTLHGQVTQKVHVIGPDGRPVTAFYPMTQLPDGTWRIDGCYLQAPEEHQA